MSDASDIPARYQIAEAGFGAMMERHGFKLVPNARCHWRRDGDRVTWRVAIYHLTVMGADDGYWFDINVGVHIHGLDEAYSKLGKGPLSETMRGTRAKMHSSGSMISSVIHYEKIRYEHETYGRKSRLGKFLYHLHPVERPVFREWMDLPCLSPVPHQDYFAFNLREHDVNWLAGQISDLFEKHEIPLIEMQNSIRAYYEVVYGPKSGMTDLTDEERYLMAYLAGDLDFFHQMAREQFATDKKSFEEIRAELREERRKRSKDSFDYAKEHQLTEDEHVIVDWLADKAWNRQVLNKLRTLDLPVKDPGIDFSLLEKAERDWGERDHPDIETRQKLKAQGIDWTLPYRS